MITLPNYDLMSLSWISEKNTSKLQTILIGLQTSIFWKYNQPIPEQADPRMNQILVSGFPQLVFLMEVLNDMSLVLE